MKIKITDFMLYYMWICFIIYPLAYVQITFISKQAPLPRYFIVPTLVGFITAYFTAMLSKLKQEKETEKIRVKLEQTERMNTLGILVSSTAHDLNNILQGLKASISLAKSHINEPEKLEKILRNNEACLTRGKDLVVELVQFSKGNDIAYKNVEINNILEQLLNVLNGLTSRNVSVNVKIPSETLYFFGNSTQIFQVLLNLSVNALHAMKNIERGVLSVSVYRQDEWLIVTVTDNGIGLSNSGEKDLFELFKTTKGNEGSGIGLYSCKKIIEGHKGKIDIISEPNKGTEFTIHLPLFYTA